MKLLLCLIVTLTFSLLANAQWTTNGTGDAYNTNSSGKVGIGTGSPVRKFHLSAANASVQQRFERTGSGNGVTDVGVDDQGFKFFVGGYDASSLNVLLGNNGNVGIGTFNPSGQLHLASDQDHAFKITRSNGLYGFRIFRNATYGYVYFQNTDDNSNWGTRIQMGEGGNTWQNLFLNPNGGNVGIGTTSPDSKLAVKGTIHSNEVKVDLLGSVAPDYVFEKDYPLTSLDELKTYIDQHKHLPEIPSAKQMEEEGINLKEMNLMLLKKIEELTLHLIEQNKQIEEDRVSADSSTKKVEELMLHMTVQQKKLENYHLENQTLAKEIIELKNLMKHE